MKKFLVLYSSPISPAEMMSSMTPEQAKAGMDMWNAWAQRAGDAIVDLGTPVSAAARVERGGVAASESQVAGFSIMQADDLEDLQKLLSDHPHLETPDGSIEVLETLSIPGM